MRVDVVDHAEALSQILEWARSGKGRSVCLANVHMVMEGHDNPELRRIVNQADLVVPDGMPLVWAQRLLGSRSAGRVRGSDLTRYICEAATEEGIPVGFYGSTAEVQGRMIEVLSQRFPRLEVVYHWSPPFRDLTPEEHKEIAQEINESGARILFVGLGCPKQEYWMGLQSSNLESVMLGVGAAFDFLAGRKKEAPNWMRDSGLEWCHRLLTEPRRLWRRYLYHNPRFVMLCGLQLLRGKTFCD